MDAISRMNLLNVRFIPVARRVKLGTTERLGEVGSEPLVVVRMQPMLKRMSRFRVLKAKLVPAPGEGKNPVKTSK